MPDGGPSSPPPRRTQKLPCVFCPNLPLTGLPSLTFLLHTSTTFVLPQSGVTAPPFLNPQHVLEPGASVLHATRSVTAVPCTTLQNPLDLPSGILASPTLTLLPTFLKGLHHRRQATHTAHIRSTFFALSQHPRISSIFPNRARDDRLA